MIKSAWLSFVVLLASIGQAFAGNWLSYINTEYGFSISYPQSDNLKQAFEPHYLIGKTWRYGALGNTGKPIVSITRPLQGKADYAVTAVRIGVSDDLSDINKCTTGKSEEKDIGGIKWFGFPIADTAMSQSLKGVSYRTVYQGRCYAIEQILTYSLASVTNEEERKKVLENLDEAYNRMSSVVDTFHFAE